jgi:hypothetical protein
LYGTRANIKKKMERFEQESQALREEMTTVNTKLDELADMKTKMEELTNLVKLLAVTHIPPPPPPPVSFEVEALVSTGPEWTFYVDTPKYSAPQRSMPWGMPSSAGEIPRPTTGESPMPTFQRTTHVPQQVTSILPAVVTYSAPAVHTIPQEEEPIF